MNKILLLPGILFFVFVGLFIVNFSTKTQINVNGETYECRGTPIIENGCIHFLDYNTNASIVICNVNTYHTVKPNRFLQSEPPSSVSTGTDKQRNESNTKEEQAEETRWLDSQ